MWSWRAPHFIQGSRTLVAKSMAPSNDIEQFRFVLRKSRNIVAVAGAGLSAASGQITFSTLSQLQTDKSATVILQAYQPLEMQEVFGGLMTP
jgi:hypothetical protein